MNPKYELILFDMDGTLLSSEKTLLPSSLEALRLAQSEGLLMAYGTGRSISELRPYKDMLQPIRYGVLESGALVYDFHEKKILGQTCFSPELVRRIIEVSREEDVMVQFMSKGQVYLCQDDEPHMERYFADQFRPLYRQVCAWVPDCREEALSRITDIEKINLFHADTDARRRSRERLADLPIEMAYSEITSLELSPKDVHKGNGLLDLCQALHIDPAKSAAVGDADNDLAMLRTAGLPIAMGNANDTAKSLASLIVADNDHDGIAQAVHAALGKEM